MICPVFRKILTALPFALLLPFGFFLNRQASAPAPRALVAWPEEIKYFSFGQRLVLSDLGWIRSIQDFDYCEKSGQQTKCRQDGWLFQMLNTISELDPQFRAPVAQGGLALSIILSDISGAAKIYEKGVQRFPKDWRLAYQAAYHALFEEQNAAKAASLMEAAARSGAPEWVYSLAGRLYSRAGQIELGERLLRELEQNPSISKEVLQQLRLRIQEGKGSGQ